MPCGVPKTRSNDAARSGAPGSSKLKIPPPSSFTTTTVRSGWRSRGPTTSAFASCTKVRSPTRAYVGALAPSASPVAVDTLPSIPAKPRLARTRGPPTVARSRSRTALDEPANKVAPGGTEADTTPATAEPDGQDPATTPATAAVTRSPACHHALAHAWSRCPCATGASSTDNGCTRTARLPGSGQPTSPLTSSTSTLGSRSSAAAARASVTRPTTSTVFGRCTWSQSVQVNSSDPDGVARALAPPLEGSATSGHPRASASRAANEPQSVPSAGRSPTSTSVRGPSFSASPGARTRVPTATQGCPPARPSSGSTQVGSSSGTRGSRSGTLRCTGPGVAPRAPVAALSARVTVDRQDATWPTRPSGVPRSCAHRVAGPKMPTCWVAWLAPTPRSSGGRSAVITTSGTPACEASSTAGCRLATAVPDVVTIATGPLTLASPTARNAALRSSMRTCSVSRSAVSASSSAYASGAEREPGQSTT